jgi:hypothetical protein
MLIRIKDTVIDLRSVELIQFIDLYKSIKIIFSSGYEKPIEFTEEKTYRDLEDFFYKITPDILTEEGRNIFLQTSRFLTKHQFGIKEPLPDADPNLRNIQNQ